jgi:ABC-2 type transport system permease protein
MKTAGLYFFAGYIPWMFFLAATVGATTAIVGNAQYVNRIYVPRAIFPIAIVLVGFVDLLAGLGVVLAYMISTGAAFTPALAILPLSVVVLAVFLLGMAFFCASVNVFVRDFQYLWATLTFLWFFFTPILYPLSTIPATVRPYFEMNPVLPFIALFQEPICHGAIPPVGTIGLAGIYAVAALVLGAGVFFRSERSFYLYL